MFTTLKNMINVSSLLAEIATLESKVRELRKDIKAWHKYALQVESERDYYAKRYSDVRLINSDLVRQYSEVCDLLATYQAANFVQSDMFSGIGNFGAIRDTIETRTYRGDVISVALKESPDNASVASNGNGHNPIVASDQPAIVTESSDNDLIIAKSGLTLTDAQRLKAYEKLDSWRKSKANFDFAEKLVTLHKANRLGD